MYVLGSLMQNTTWLLDDKYTLGIEDFTDPMYQTIFGAIHNLAIEGVETISPHDLDLALSNYPDTHAEFRKNEGLTFIGNVLDVVSEEQEMFDIHYKRVKKFTVLRQLQNSGIDTTKIYNPASDFTLIDEENAKLDKMEVREIINSVKETISDIETSNLTKEGVTPQFASFNIKENIEKWKSSPDIGEPLDGEIFNYALRGARKGAMYVLSAPTGHGKTRYMVSNACSLALPKLSECGEKITLRDGLKKCIYMGTELEFEEIQRMILAYVSGVDEGVISRGATTEADDQRIQKAAIILEKYGENFFIAPVSDMTITEMKAKLIGYILKHGYEYIFYDYLEIGVGLMNEFRDLSMRNDEVLLMMSTALKDIAVNYDVFVQTATQTNAEWSKTNVRNQNCVAGAKSILNKADAGMVGINLAMHQEELENISTVLEAQGIPRDKWPNVVYDIYKNRSGVFTGVKIWRRFDYAKFTTEDVMMTDQYYNLLDPLKERIEYDHRTMDLLDILTTEDKGVFNNGE